VDALLNVAIGWESFLSDWHMAATNRKSTAFVADLQNRVEASLVGQGWSGLKRRPAPSLPKSRADDEAPKLAEVPLMSVNVVTSTVSSRDYAALNK
jgi:hypothetical protein